MYYNTNKLKELSQHRKLSQQDVASAVNMSQTAYSAIETKRTKVEVDRLLAIAGFYNVNAQELIEGDNVIMNFNEKVENGYASFIQTLNIEHKEFMDALKKQLEHKDEQIKSLLKILADKK